MLFKYIFGFPGILTILTFGILIAMIVRNLVTWSKNNRAPRLTVPATLVVKRTNVSHHHSGGKHPHTSTSITYHATFQVGSGDQMEFQISGAEYNLLAEGDSGTLSFQGTRYLNFERM